jgi:hypothetical protein
MDPSSSKRSWQARCLFLSRSSPRIAIHVQPPRGRTATRTRWGRSPEDYEAPVPQRVGIAARTGVAETGRSSASGHSRDERVWSNSRVGRTDLRLRAFCSDQPELRRRICPWSLKCKEADRRGVIRRRLVALNDNVVACVEPRSSSRLHQLGRVG